MAEIRHVVPASKGGWLVVKEPRGGEQSADATFERRRDAETFAKNVVRSAGGGEVVLHTPSGRITEVDKVGTPQKPAVPA
jgi:hypothetical protein